MKKFILFLAFVISLTAIRAQVGITDSPTENFESNTVNSNAVLELRSSSKGFLFPRLTQAQINTITTSLTDQDEGLTVYNLDSHLFYGWHGISHGGWIMLTNGNAAPQANNVHVSGTDFNVGTQLNGSYDYFDYEGDTQGISVIQWKSANNSTGTGATSISGATTSSYTLQATDNGNYIAF